MSEGGTILRCSLASPKRLLNKALVISGGWGWGGLHIYFESSVTRLESQTNTRKTTRGGKNLSEVKPMLFKTFHIVCMEQTCGMGSGGWEKGHYHLSKRKIIRFPYFPHFPSPFPPSSSESSCSSSSSAFSRTHPRSEGTQLFFQLSASIPARLRGTQRSNSATS